MVYTMEWYVDGGCRNNGNPGSYGAAAAVERLRGGRSWTYKERLPKSDHDTPAPTNQRAEITAIILAQQKALDRYDGLDSSPRIDITIHSDSQYAVDCMKTWIYKWSANGWMNAAGNGVANKDLIRKASRLDDELAELGSVSYKWIPRSENQDADAACNEELDAMLKEEQNGHNFSDNDLGFYPHGLGSLGIRAQSFSSDDDDC